MKKRNCYIIAPFLMMALFLSSCDESTVGSFHEKADKVPNFSVIEGAENVTLRVDRNNDRGYFNVNLSGVRANNTILDGDYLGWCAHWSAPIDTRGREYDDLSLYSTYNDKNWNKLNYVLNKRSEYFRTIDGVSYKEIQAVIWTLIDYKEFDIDENQIFDELNRSAFDAVLEDVKKNGDDFRHTPGSIHAIFADASVHETNDKSTQTVIIEGTAWSWAAPHNLNSNSFRVHDLGQRWGWVTYYWFYDIEENGDVGDEFGENNPLMAGLYADCGFGNLQNPEPSEITDCPQVADVKMWHDNDDKLYINIFNKENEFDYPANKFSVYVGRDLPSGLGIGQFPYKKESFYDSGDPFGFDVTFTIDLEDEFDMTGPFGEPTSDDFPPESGDLPVPPLYILIHGDTKEQ
ncbi:hypothetical protein [Natronogracilivirga saccharolytica]|uniref:Uncharacterized protein n=1 Tax=Natronogracilivirga saccharolytica TaxID=2812953 RepID=A0A8J7RI97_9BACT|nr:hypothetical protein [Natronogracilivirga saccharolytica]MBP3192295.1 hypothetical protein [Natronogracilivirga saccharolytica]